MRLQYSLDSVGAVIVQKAACSLTITYAKPYFIVLHAFNLRYK